MFNSFVRLSAALVAVWVLTGSAWAIGPFRYRIDPYPLPQHSSNGIALPLDINDRGELAGQAKIFELGVANAYHATLFQFDWATDQTPLEKKTTQARGINNDRVMAGYKTESIFGTDRQVPAAFVDANMIELTPAGGAAAWGTAEAVRNATQADIVGETVASMYVSTGLYHATYWEQIGPTAWSVRDLGTLTTDDSVSASGAADINADGHVVGWSDSELLPDGTHGTKVRPFYMPSGGAMMNLGLLPGMDHRSTGRAEAIGDAGHVVGWYDDFDRQSNVDERAFLWSPTLGMGEVRPPAGYSELRLEDVNNDGIALGTAKIDGWTTVDAIYFPGHGTNRAMSFQDQLLHPDFASWQVGVAAINNRGQLAVNGRDGSGNRFVGIARPSLIGPNAVAAGTFPTAGQLPPQWTSSGDGSAMVVPDPAGGENLVVAMTTGSPIVIQQSVDTPGGEFQVAFDMQFTTTTGVLGVRLGGKLLETFLAPAAIQDRFIAEQLIVADSALFGEDGAMLSFELDGPAGSQVLIDNVELFALETVEVPEPVTLAMWGVGVIVWVGRARRSSASR